VLTIEIDRGVEDVLICPTYNQGSSMPPTTQRGKSDVRGRK